MTARALSLRRSPLPAADAPTVFLLLREPLWPTVMAAVVANYALLLLAALFRVAEALALSVQHELHVASVREPKDWSHAALIALLLAISWLAPRPRDLGPALRRALRRPAPDRSAEQPATPTAATFLTPDPDFPRRTRGTQTPRETT